VGDTDGWEAAAEP
jgi:hypothetical protein